MSVNTLDISGELTAEQQKITAEIRELDLLIESTQTEVNRLTVRENHTKTRVDEVRGNPGNFQREDIFGATDEHASAISRRMTMEGQLGTLQGKRKLLDRVQTLLTAAQQHVRDNASAAPMPAGTSPVIDEFCVALVPFRMPALMAAGPLAGPTAAPPRLMAPAPEVIVAELAIEIELPVPDAH